MSFEVEYKLFNGRSKKKSNNNLKINQTPILNSLVNTYALSLFVGKFYDFNENDHALLEKVVNKERDKQTEKFMDEVCKVCGKDENLIVNVPRLRGYIKNFDEQIKSKRKQINIKLEKICEEFFALIKIDQNLVPSQKQHINDKNSYILAPNFHLEKHVKSLKSRSIGNDDKKFAYMQDAAFIMMCLSPGYYFWDCVYTDFSISQPDDLTFYLSGYVYEEAKVQRFLKSMNVLIIKRGFVMGLDRDNQTLVFSNMGSEIFELEIFKDRYISFREDDALVIFSPAFFGNFDQIYDEIWKIKQNVIKIKTTPTKKSLKSLDDSLLLDPELIYKSLKDENIFALNKFKKELKDLKNDLSYKNFEINKDRYARQWLIDDIYGLYLAVHAPFKYKNSKELAKIYFEDLLGKSLNLFIDEKRSPALGHRIDDIELL